MKVLSRTNVLFAAILAIFTFSSCEQGFLKPCFKGEGDIVTETLELQSFDKIVLDGSMNVVVSQGATQEVRAIGHSNIIERLKTSVSSDRWDIEFKNGCYKNVDLEIRITVPNLEEVKISGSGNVVINDFDDQKSLENVISGSGRITLNEFEGITDLDVLISGSGSFKANDDISSLEDLDVKISGSGKYQGFAISSEDATAKVSGSGRCELTVQDDLDATVSGSGDILYKGTATVSKKVSGSGSIVDVN